MMYTNKFVACIKTNGRVLREINGQVIIPFGSEYSILLKNLNSCRAHASISIDGKDATGGTKLILEANQNFEIERFIVNGNLSSGNSFKFIERTSDIEKHRGIGSDDGLVRIEFWKEVVQPDPIKIPRIEYYPVPTPYPDPYIPWDRRNPWSPRRRRLGDHTWRGMRALGQTANGPTMYKNTTSGMIPGMDSVQDSSFSFTSFVAGACASETPLNDAGITAPGSVSGQVFHEGAWFQTEAQSTVIVLQLKGIIQRQHVKKAVTVKKKLNCVSCGLANKYPAQFCSRCGTGLELVG